VSGDPIRILLIDDDEDDHVLTRETLAECYREGFQLDWAIDHRSGLSALLSGCHDVCLLDYRLGERTGVDLLRLAVENGCRTPVIVLTGQGERWVDIEAMQTGAVDFLVKGQFGPSLLERSIRYALERQRGIDALRRSVELFALAVRGANDGLWDWDLLSDRLYYAPRWKSMLGYSEDQIGEESSEWFSRIHELDMDLVKSAIQAHRSGKTPHLEVEYRMLHADGKYRWVLTRGLAVRDAHGQAVRMVGSQTDITQRRAAEERLQHDALHDALTGLPNRVLVLDRLARAIERGRRRDGYRFAVLFLDLDGFKLINDSLGHHAGDQYLTAVSRRLEACSRATDTVGRLGGDEFVVLMDDFADPSDILRVADRVLEDLRTPINLNGHETVTSASIGIAIGGPQYFRAEDILRDADVAMYRAKSRGKDGRVIFDEPMHARAVARMKLELELRQAVVRQEYRLHYQPIVSLRSGRVTGFEALARWQHPERGLVAPDEFIPVAEETGIILPLGMWVLREAAWQLRRWQDQFRSSPKLTMSVNLSSRQFFQPDLVAQIERVLLESEIDARCLRLEITESVVMDRAEVAPEALSRLSSVGVRLAMDGFGKGYSSLGCLNKFPFDTLKIDRSFIERLGESRRHAQIIRTILTMAEECEMDVVAEGLETAEQLAQLREMGCRLGQGFYFAEPRAAELAGKLLAEPPRWLEREPSSSRSATFRGDPKSGSASAGSRRAEIATRTSPPST
jgi:diguanylate cyclase (GGDEF)-like protein/PAS domain S-box-containing protein